MARGSPEWCYSTIDRAKSVYQRYETGLEYWEKIIAEIEEAHVYDRVPVGRPYGSLDALLKAELGVSYRESCVAVAARAQTAVAIGANGVKVNDITCAVGTPAPISRGSNNADYLTARIARDRPDILERMKAGEFRSVRAAALEPGIVRPTRVIYIDDPEDAARQKSKNPAGNEPTGRTQTSCSGEWHARAASMLKD
jgi:hypothetical protein